MAPRTDPVWNERNVRGGLKDFECPRTSSKLSFHGTSLLCACITNESLLQVDNFFGVMNFI